MTPLDRPAFAEAMFVLGEAFNEPVSETRTEAYFDALGDLALVDVNRAVRLALRTCRFFPKPVEIRELLAGRPDDNAELAWGAVIREIRRVGYLGAPTLEPRALRAVRELWGSWRRLCETLPAEGPELVGWTKQFKATYLATEHEAARQLTPETVAPNVLAFIQSEQRRITGAS